MQKQYPLSKEEMSLYLTCTLNPNRKQAYLVGWSVELPKNTDRSRIENAVAKLFARHRILSARITRDSQGNLCKYDSEESPVIEYETSQTDFPPIENYYDNINLDGEKLYRIVIVDTPNSVTLIMIVHHIILDGNSRQVMGRDFEAAFRGDELGEPDLLPYTFAEKEQEQEKSEAFAEDKEYYKNLLSDIECQFPEHDIHEEKESFDYCFYDLDNINISELKNKKGSTHVRTSTIFLGAVEQAFALFSGTEQFVVASAMSGRTDENKNSCGMFVRTLPMVCNTDPNRTINEYLQELDEQTTENRKHSLYTYMDINQELNVSLPVIFAYQGDMIGDRILFDGEECRTSYVLSTESDYLIQIYIWRKNNKYILEIAYRADLYSKSYMDCFAQTVEQILSELLCKDKMSEIEFVSPLQKEILDGFNKTECDYDKSDIVTQFRTQAAAHPDNIAVIFKDKKLTYREVDVMTDRIAAFIAKKGIGCEDVVSILIPRSEYMVIASLGVLKSGAAYEPLDPSYPSERLEFMIQDAGAKLLIAERSLMQNVPNYKGDVIYIDEIPNIDVSTSLNMTSHPKLNDRFIMLYTSGTTGVPKGVMLEHGNLAAFCGWYRRFYSLTEQSRVAAYASYGFDANMMDMYPALTTGAAVVIIPEEDRLDLIAIKRRFDNEGVTHSFMTTQVGRQFADFYEGGSLKYLSVGGEKLAPIFVEKSFKFYNVYGPTECTIFSSTFEVDKLYERVPIGKSLDNMKFYVCDKTLRRLPAFAPGELVISSVQVGRGYLNRPEKNNEVFIKNPFEKLEGYEKAYRTGDVVRLLGDGNVDCIGRNDGQVKIRGFRIELPEIESVIREYK
ncbi:MAG: amino acid adenylation domain-containing protein, partial [Spirochaetales bacterium]|nr:amino acid adenylation domain-containing protein [Spirochaetales bacterium]